MCWLVGFLLVATSTTPIWEHDMARTIKTASAAPTPVLDAESQVDAIPDDKTEGEIDDLRMLLSNLAGSSTSNVTVYRVAKGKPLSYLFACTPDAFSLDELRDKHRGGEFRLYITKDGTLVKNKRVFVDPPSQQDQEAAPPQAELVAAMREGFLRQAEVLERAVGRAAAPVTASASPFAGIDIPAVISAVAAAVTALRPAPTPPPPTPAVDSGKAIDMFIQGLELGRDLRQDGGNQEPSLLGMLSDVIKSPMMAQAVTAAVRQPARQLHNQGGPSQQVGQKPQPTPTPVPAPPVPTPNAQSSFTRESTAMPNHNQMFAEYLKMFCAKAAAGSDPSLYADLVLDNLDDETLQAILDGTPTPVDFLAQYYPPVIQYKQWFETLIQSINGALDADSNNEAQYGELSQPIDHNASIPPPPNDVGGASTGGERD